MHGSSRQVEERLREENPEAIVIGQRWPGCRSIFSQERSRLEEKDLTRPFPRVLGDFASLYADFAGAVVLEGHSASTDIDCHWYPAFFASSLSSPPTMGVQTVA